MLTIVWSAYYHPEWDTSPNTYVDEGIVQLGRSRRLAKCQDTTVAFTAYIGIYHPAATGYSSESVAAFFLSLILGGHTISLQTYLTMAQVSTALDDFYRRLLPNR